MIPTLVFGLLGPSAGARPNHREASPKHPAISDLATVEVPEVDLLTLTPRMAKFLVKKIGPSQARNNRLEDLFDAIFGKKGLGIEYGNTRTKTAAETFEERSGNCLSFTFLFVGMARHLGLNAYFAEVTEVLSWDQRGEIVVSNKHMFAEVEIENAIIHVDFLPGAEKRYKATRRISDRRALAHYYNNVGAEQLTTGDVATSIAYLRKALEIEPELSSAQVNLGFAYRQAGDLEAAEASYLQALEIDPRELAAASNLAGLYLTQGRQEDAQPYLRKVQDHLQRNPFHHFRLGVQKAEIGDSTAAIRHLKEAVRRMPKDPIFHDALADVYTRIGEPQKALESLKKAIRHAEDEQRDELRAKLAALESTG